MSLVAKPSEWDTNVFGFKIGVLERQDIASVKDIDEANTGLFDVVFVKVGTWLNPRGKITALDHVYDMEIPNIWTLNPCAPVIRGHSRPRHVEIAQWSFADSRFLRDPHLASKTPDLYSKWVSEHEVHMLERAPDSAFLIASLDADGSGRISLMAVDDSCRRTGIGCDLVLGTFRNPSLYPAPTNWRVKTSVRNYKAVRFYETIGFRVKSVQTVFHVWLNGEG